MTHRFQYDIPIDESKLQKTIAVSKAAFVAEEAEQTLSFAEFLYQQSKYIRKFWWAAQAVLLVAVCLFMYIADSDFYTRRTLGVAAPLFVILILPELWKNRTHDAMEVEGTTFYTLRQVYAARMTLFAGVDLVLLTAFFFSASFFARVTIMELLIQFVLPFNVACCICFGSLYGRQNSSEAFSILLCSVWTGLWILVVLSDTVYNAISVPVWMGLLAASLAYMGYSIRKGQKTIYRTWEVQPSWN